MPTLRRWHLAFAACMYWFAGMLVMGVPVEITGPLRYFSGGALAGLAVVLYIYSRRVI
jgi:hypothetical protein